MLPVLSLWAGDLQIPYKALSAGRRAESMGDREECVAPETALG